MEHRRLNGTRAVRKAARPSKTSETASYLIAHACFDCRVSTKRVPHTVGSRRCPSCGGYSYEMGRSFRAPRRSDQEQWNKVRLLFAYGSASSATGPIRRRRASLSASETSERS
jgi:hypothetical protein